MTLAARGESREKVIERAQAFAQHGAFGRAIAAVEAYLASQPDDDRMLVRLADYRRRANDDAGAVAAFSKAAGVYAARGFSAKVAAVLQQALVLAPDDLALLERLAATKAALHLPREAALVFDRMAAVAAKAGDTVRVLALRQRIHDLLPADAAARAARQLAPAAPKAAAALPRPELPPRSPTATLAEELAEADFLASQGLGGEARAILQRLQELFPDEVAVAERLEALDVELVSADELIPDDEAELAADGAGQPAESTTDIFHRAAAQVTPNASEAATHQELANAFFEIDRFDDALAEVEKALAIDPASAGMSHLIAGRCHLAHGAPHQAIEAYRLALDAKGLSFDLAVEVLCELGHSYELAGEHEEALRCFAEAKRLEPGLEDEERLLDAG